MIYKGIKMNREKLFKKFIALKAYKHLSFLKDYACMDSQKLIDLEGALYARLLKDTNASKIYYAVEYEKANFCKYLQAFYFEPYPFTYSECIEADINGLYQKLNLKDQKILLKNYIRLAKYEKTFDKKYLKNNIFVMPRGI